MTIEPPRIIDDPTEKSALRNALDHATTDGPQPAELEALLSAVVGSGPTGGHPPASGGTTGSAGALSTAAGAKLGALGLLAGALALGGGSLLLQSRTEAPGELPARDPRTLGGAATTTPSAIPSARSETASRRPPAVPPPGAEKRQIGAPSGHAAAKVEPKPDREGEALRQTPQPPSSPDLRTTDVGNTSAAPIVTEAVTTELELLNQAERLLAADSARAFELTERHRREFPAGRLTEEREVIAIEALARLGQRETALRRFATFERRFGGSVHRPRLEQMLRTSSK